MLEAGLSRKAPIQAERHHAILREIDLRGSVRVANLAARFTVTPETIRRDLDALESAGLLHRTHGGAVAPQSQEDAPFAVRRVLNAGAKSAIARAALRLAVEHDVIALDASTTSLALATLLPDEPRTVVTNSVPIASELASKANITLVLTGGTLDQETLGLQGSVACRTLSQFACSIAFFSCFGYDPQRGAGEASEGRAEVKRAMIDAADRAVLLADRSKFERRPPFFFCRPSDLHQVISESTSGAR